MFFLVIATTILVVGSSPAPAPAPPPPVANTDCYRDSCETNQNKESWKPPNKNLPNQVPQTSNFCYGPGEYPLGTAVHNTKCPQLPITTRVCDPQNVNHGAYCDIDTTDWNGAEAIPTKDGDATCIALDGGGNQVQGTCLPDAPTVLLQRVAATKGSPPVAFTAGVCATGNQVYRSSCTVPKSTCPSGIIYGVVGLDAGGKPISSNGDFQDVYAPWVAHKVTGVGIDGYYTEFASTSQTNLAHYGWVDGFVPNLHPNHNNGNGIPPISIGMEVLCRDPKHTCGAFYEGKVVDASLNGKWVCKLNRLDIQILPFVEPIDIRPLCFAKEQDYVAADEGHWPGKHPHPNWREERLNKTTTKAGSWPTTYPTQCNAFCEISIEQSGNCPDYACLGQHILERSGAVSTDKGTGGYFKDADITGIFLPPFPDPTKPPPRPEWVFKYAVDNSESEINPTWGPRPGTDAESYIVPKTPLKAATTDTDMYGNMVICVAPVDATHAPLPPGSSGGCGAQANVAATTNMCDNPLAGTDQCPCYSLGTIFNVPSVTKQTTNGANGDGKYHMYPCDDQTNMKPHITCGDNTADSDGNINMWKICYPAQL